MSDLISRKALLESFRKCYSGHMGMEQSDSMMMFRSICKIINEQPTAYDLDKVCEKLLIMADEANDKILASEDGMQCYYDGKEDGLTEAAEIVKQGVTP